MNLQIIRYFKPLLKLDESLADELNQPTSFPGSCSVIVNEWQGHKSKTCLDIMHLVQNYISILNTFELFTLRKAAKYIFKVCIVLLYRPKPIYCNYHKIAIVHYSGFLSNISVIS